MGQQAGGIDTAKAASDNYGINFFRVHGNVPFRSQRLSRFFHEASDSKTRSFFQPGFVWLEHCLSGIPHFFEDFFYLVAVGKLSKMLHHGSHGLHGALETGEIDVIPDPLLDLLGRCHFGKI